MTKPIEHPILQEKPTLSDYQSYIKDALAYYELNGSAQYCLLMLTEEVGELAKAVRKSVGGKMDVTKPDAHADEEAADVLWMLICVCNALGINLEKAFRAKQEVNKKRTWK